MNESFFPYPSNAPRPFRVIGAGSLIVDLVAEVSDAFIARIGRQKGGMELVDSATLEEIVALLPSPPMLSAGGSAANTIHGLAHLGVPCTFLGKLGADANRDFYVAAYQSAGVDTSRIRYSDAMPTGRCLSLVTPDSERTLCTDLGASGSLSVDDVNVDDFRDCDYVHIEGYLLFNRELAVSIMQAAKTAGAIVGLDLASFEVVRANRDVLDDLLSEYVDVVYANEDEAEAFCGVRTPEAGLAALAEHCCVAIVKLGADGARIQASTGTVAIDAVSAQAVDTTGAGDLWAAGFLYAALNGSDPAIAGKCGAVTGAEVVQVFGAALPDAAWERTREQFKNND
jgi:sugar/nucleoside kinase (ribokinase family)